MLAQIAAEVLLHGRERRSSVSHSDEKVLVVHLFVTEVVDLVYDITISTSSTSNQPLPR